MAERPTPHSIAVCTLIALHSDPLSPLHEINFNPHENDVLETVLEECLVGNQESFVVWMRRLREHVGNGIGDLLKETLDRASESVDSFFDLMESLRGSIGEGLVDATSAHGVYLRQVCLGFEQLSFEAATILWQALQEELTLLQRKEAGMEQGDDDDKDKTHQEEEAYSSWPLSPTQLERNLRRDCSMIEKGSSASFAERELGIRRVLDQDPELPAAYFLRFLNCLQHGERVGALDALHQYFDHAMIQNQSDIFQFADNYPVDR